MTKSLAEPLSQLQQTARHIAEISQECKLDMEPDAYVESFKPFSMDITYHWSQVQCPKNYWQYVTLKADPEN